MSFAGLRARLRSEWRQKSHLSWLALACSLSEGKLSVRLTRKSMQAVLEVSDDGPGLPSRVSSSNPGTLGLQLVHLLSAQLGGALSIERAGGTRFCVSFPLHDVSEAA